MTDKAEDRGDDIIVTDDTGGDTPDPSKVEKQEPEKEPEKKEEPAKEEPEKKEEKDPKGQLTIPKKVFDERLAKSKAREEAAQKRAEEAEAKLQAQNGTVDAAKIEDEIDKAEEELEQAIADGNVEKKVALRKLIRSKNQQLAESRAAVLAAQGTAVAIEQVLYNAVVDRMETEHPELNPDNEDKYDQDVVDEITELKEAFEAKGLSSSESLKKAIKLAYKNAVAKEPEKEPEETIEQKAARLASERAEKARVKGLEAKKGQPADASKAGLDSDKAGAKLTSADIAKMSDKEFDALPEADKKKFRGDE